MTSIVRDVELIIASEYQSSDVIRLESPDRQGYTMLEMRAGADMIFLNNDERVALIKWLTLHTKL